MDVWNISHLLDNKPEKDESFWAGTDSAIGNHTAFPKTRHQAGHEPLRSDTTQGIETAMGPHGQGDSCNVRASRFSWEQNGMCASFSAE